MFEPLARGEVVFAGQPVALVIAESEAAASDAVDLVTVDAERLDPVLDLHAAMDAGAPPARIKPLVEVEDDDAGAAKAAHAVLGAPLGGAFGSKVIVVEPLVAGAVLALHRPVRLALTRREDFAATNPASASVIEIKIGAKRSGELVAIDARLAFDAGAYTEWTIEAIA